MEDIETLLTEIQLGLSEYNKAVKYEDDIKDNNGILSKLIILSIAKRIEHFFTTKDDEYFKTIEADVLDQFLISVCNVLSNISESCLMNGDLSFINESIVFVTKLLYFLKNNIIGSVDEVLSTRISYNLLKILIAEWAVSSSQGDLLHITKLEFLSNALNDKINPDLLYISEPESLVYYYYFYIRLNHNKLVMYYDNNEHLNSYLTCLRLFKIIDRITNEYNDTRSNNFRKDIHSAMKRCSDCLIDIAKIANDTFTILGNDKSRIQEYIDKVAKFLDEKDRKVLYSGQYLKRCNYSKMN